ncbi:MAG: hypothetical protein M3Z25_14275 [Actinomycetota bacterium]|nr:hypothetical protein [Actinomycetota bacterium]
MADTDDGRADVVELDAERFVLGDVVLVAVVFALAAEAAAGQAHRRYPARSGRGATTDARSTTGGWALTGLDSAAWGQFGP